MCGCIGNGILARSPIRPNSAWKALGVMGPSRSVMKTCEDSPCSRCRRRSEDRSGGAGLREQWLIPGIVAPEGPRPATYDGQVTALDIAGFALPVFDRQER